MALAKAEFDRVISLVDELAAAGNDGVSDLRTLAAGFRDLSEAALAPPPPPPPPAPVEPEPAPAPPPPPDPDPTRIYGPDDEGVVRPEVVSRALPPWRPYTPAEALFDNKGMIELLIDETGRVVQATIVESINPRYDPLLLRAAAGWKFVPAQKNGQAVKFRYRIGLQLNKTS
jgi:TonB family protein